jgi:hypothetical protein
MRREFYTA